MTKRTLDYDTPSDYTFGADIEIADGQAQLLLQGQDGAFEQDFASDSGFTYDADAVEFAGGQAQQLLKISADARAGATMATSADFNWGDGVLTATLGGDATVAEGRLDLGQEGYMQYDAAGKINASKGSIKAKYTFEFTGTPDDTQFLMHFRRTSGSSDNDSLTVQLQANGTLYLNAYSSNGSAIQFLASLGSFSPVAQQEYEIELTWYHRPQTGDTGFWLFIDGVATSNSPLAQGATSSRTDNLTTVTLLWLGRDRVTTGSSFAVRDLIIYDEPENRTGYTPGYDVPESAYLNTLVTLPAFAYPGANDISSFDAFATSEAGAPVYSIDRLYYDGANWVASDDTAGQMNTAAEVVTNIATLPASNTPAVRVRFPASASTQSSVSNISLDYAGEGYATMGPPVVAVTSVTAEGLTTLATTGAGVQRYYVSVDGAPVYHDGANWVASDLTVAQSNTLAEVNANAGTLAFAASGSQLKIGVLLVSDGATESSVSSLTLTYDFSTGGRAELSLTSVYGWLSNPDNSPRVGTAVSATASKNIEAASLLVLKGTSAETVTDAVGFFELQVAPGGYVLGVGVYSYEVIVPSEPGVNVGTLIVGSTC